MKNRDYATALKEFLPLAKQGDAMAQLYVGGIYYYGYGVPQDYKEAMRWYRLAAEKSPPSPLRVQIGGTTAQDLIGFMYANGQGVPQDYKDAMRWYRSAAEQGEAGAQVVVGDMYRDGQG